jgi:hypothetical protein
VAVGVIVVVALLLPARASEQRRIDQLRRSSANGTLVEDARRRASAALAAERRRALPGGPAARAALVLAALTTLYACVVHAAVCPEHFREGLRFGLFFLFASVDQLVVAAVLVRRPSQRVVWLAVLVNGGTALLWAVTRTVGLPFGLGELEAVGWADLTASLAELVAAGAALFWLRSVGGRVRWRTPGSTAPALH